MIGRLAGGRFSQLSGPTVSSESALEIEIAGFRDTATLAVAVNQETGARPGSVGLLAAGPLRLAVKRAMDIAGSLALILLLSPVLIGVSVAVGLTSPGPILYRQQRVGRSGMPFTMLKFRSMNKSAHEYRHLHDELNEVTGPVFKIRDDPRVTGVGRMIRRLSIDELPQLFDVLKGEMSLVGPRPPLPEECAHYGEREMGRLLVKPGLTCRWQVSGRSDVDFDTWVEMDLEYIHTWTLRQDIALLLKTIPAVLSGRGAY